MPDAVPHLGVLDGDDDPLGVVQDMPVLPRSGRKADVPGLRLDGLAVGVGFEMARIVF